MEPLNVRGYEFHPVIRLPSDYEVYDFTAGYDPERALSCRYGIGRYDEKRAGMYETELFRDPRGDRDVHIGIDIGAPVGEPVHAFHDGEVHLFGYNGAPGDYGYTLVTHHLLNGRDVWALHGHLAARSVASRAPGQPIARGEIIAWVGDRHENGGWNPHLHFQLSLVRPEVPDMPGAVREEDRSWARATYPDPRLVLGPLY